MPLVSPRMQNSLCAQHLQHTATQPLTLASPFFPSTGSFNRTTYTAHAGIRHVAAGPNSLNLSSCITQTHPCMCISVQEGVCHKRSASVLVGTSGRTHWFEGSTCATHAPRATFVASTLGTPQFLPPPKMAPIGHKTCVNTPPSHNQEGNIVNYSAAPGTTVSLLDCQILKWKLLTLFQVVFALKPSTSIPVWDVVWWTR